MSMRARSRRVRARLARWDDAMLRKGPPRTARGQAQQRQRELLTGWITTWTRVVLGVAVASLAVFGYDLAIGESVLDASGALLGAAIGGGYVGALILGINRRVSGQ